MPTKRLFFLFLVLIIAFGSSALIAEEDPEEEMCVPMGTIELSPPESVDAKRSPVDFPHSAHFVHYDCKTCHHKWDGASKITSCTTSACHDLEEAPERTPGKKIDKAEQARYYKTAFHGQCIDCHKTIVLRNFELEKAKGLENPEIVVPGPRSCNQCHPK